MSWERRVWPTKQGKSLLHIIRDRNGNHKNTISGIKFGDVEMIPVHVCVSMCNNKQAIIIVLPIE